MSIVADVSLAIIAATCLIVTGVTVAVFVMAWRVVVRVQTVVAAAQRVLPLVTADLRNVLVRTEDVLGTVSKTHAVLQSGIEALIRMQDVARQAAQTIGAGAAVLAAIRAGLRWSRSRPRVEHRG
ncbi:MAG TPA: hypothetical protein VKZ50_02605 [bacterium]|nr:hypothetical protein [bacterium]